jgi:hypothetical protein
MCPALASTRLPRERLAERVSAASYGTVLVLAALPLLDADNVDSGLGWELIAAVGIATWVAHLYAEVVGDQVRHTAAPRGREIRRAMSDGVLIVLAALAPAAMLLLGRVDVLDPAVALWAAIAVAFFQLVGLGGFVGVAVSTRRAAPFIYGGVTAGIGVLVVVIKLLLSH